MHLTFNQKKQPAFVGTVRLTPVMKTIKKLINDHHNQKYCNGLLNVKSTHQLSSPDQIQHTNAKSTVIDVLNYSYPHHNYNRC